MTLQTAIAKRLPFKVWQIHSGNGAEFINHHLMRRCARKKILMTRGHPHHSNDNQAMNELLARRGKAHTPLATHL